MVHIRGTSLSLLYPPGVVPWPKIHPEVSSSQYIWWYTSRLTKGKCWDTQMTLRTSCMAIWSKPADAYKTVPYIYSIPSRRTYYIHPLQTDQLSLQEKERDKSTLHSAVTSIEKSMRRRSHGMDGMTMWALKNATTVLGDPLTHLINSSITPGVLPTPETSGCHFNT